MRTKLAALAFWLIVWQLAAMALGHGGLFLATPGQTLGALAALLPTAGFWRRVLFTADTDYLHETLSHLSGTHLDAVFLNPLFYQACFNRRLFRGYFDTDTLCVYHVPFREDDRMHMQDMARRMPQAAREAGLRVLPLTEPMQQIEI